MFVTPSRYAVLRDEATTWGMQAEYSIACPILQAFWARFWQPGKNQAPGRQAAQSIYNIYNIYDIYGSPIICTIFEMGSHSQAEWAEWAEWAFLSRFATGECERRPER